MGKNKRGAVAKFEEFPLYPDAVNWIDATFSKLHITAEGDLVVRVKCISIGHPHDGSPGEGYEREVEGG